MEIYSQEGPGISGRNEPPTGNDGMVSARPATPQRETAAKGVIVQVINKNNLTLRILPLHVVREKVNAEGCNEVQ